VEPISGATGKPAVNVCRCNELPNEKLATDLQVTHRSLKGIQTWTAITVTGRYVPEPPELHKERASHIKNAIRYSDFSPSDNMASVRFRNQLLTMLRSLKAVSKECCVASITQEQFQDEHSRSLDARSSRSYGQLPAQVSKRLCDFRINGMRFRAK
jgi:hypothetical protein